METYTFQPNFQKGPILKDSFEKDAWLNGSVVCGLDEVGRGCLAGPLVTAAVILPCNTTSPLLKDSKLLSAKERLEAFLWIQKHCFYAVGIVNTRIIQQENILNATHTAMKKALFNLLATAPARPAAILVDAVPLSLKNTSYKEIPVHYFFKGESVSSSIAAASIVAKVFRDRLMETIDQLIPGYELAQHKGYATAHHKQLICLRQHSIMHRMLFIRKTLNEQSSHKQLSLC